MSNEVESTSVETTQEVGTTERLFGPQDDGTPTEATPAPEPEAEEKEPPVQARPRDEKGKFVAQKAAEPEAEADDEYLQIEALAKKKVKLKVGGQDSELTISDLIRKVQTDQYLTQKGQKLAEEYRQLQALKAEREQPKAQAPQATLPDDDFTREYIKPFAEQQNGTIEALKAELEGLKTIVAPVQYQNNLTKLDAEMKAQGYDDFLKYENEIKNRIYEMPVEQQVAFDTPAGFVSLYKDIKLAEYREALSKSKTETKLPDQRPKPKLVSVESGGGTPTGNDDTLSLYKAAFQKAQQSGRTQDWQEVVRLKYGG